MGAYRPRRITLTPRKDVPWENSSHARLCAAQPARVCPAAVAASSAIARAASMPIRRACVHRRICSQWSAGGHVAVHTSPAAYTRGTLLRKHRSTATPPSSARRTCPTIRKVIQIHAHTQTHTQSVSVGETRGREGGRGLCVAARVWQADVPRGRGRR
jgi:hypothetical protein